MTTPWTPAMVASCGYENKMPDPRPRRVSMLGRGVTGKDKSERQHVSHASINLIE